MKFSQKVVCVVLKNGNAPPIVHIRENSQQWKQAENDETVGPDMNKRTKRNFTLIELLVVMLLMGVLMTLMLPSFKRMISGNKVDQIASNLKLGLEQARSQAISNRRYVALILPNNNSVWSHPSVKEYCLGGFRQAFVKKNGSNWEFDGWVPGTTWRNSPQGAKVLRFESDSGTPPVAGTALDRNDITLTLADSFQGASRLESIQLYPLETDPTQTGTRSNCAVIFSPYGSMENSAFRFYVVEAIDDGSGNLLFPTRDSSNRPLNYLTLQVNQFSGKVEYL